jgi:hypothetical protein
MSGYTNVKNTGIAEQSRVVNGFARETTIQDDACLPWHVVRFWMDAPGQEERKLVRERVCPISGPGLLSKSERERRGREIIAASGADTVEYFNRVVKQQPATVVTFKQQAQRWLEHLRN